LDKVRAERGKWFSDRSELISHAKMLTDYFNFVNKDAYSDAYRQYQNVTERLEIFCRDNNLQPKAIKEVHYLCLQLERLMFEATKNSDEFISLFT
jgi:hypothetical protein